MNPLLGGLYLKELDQQFECKGLFYLRYLDDILILTHTHGQNRRAVMILNHCFNRIKVKQHPDKTFIGRIDKGFDFWATIFPNKRSPWLAAQSGNTWRVSIGFMRNSAIKKPPAKRWLLHWMNTSNAGDVGAAQA